MLKMLKMLKSRPKIIKEEYKNAGNRLNNHNDFRSKFINKKHRNKKNKKKKKKKKVNKKNRMMNKKEKESIKKEESKRMKLYQYQVLLRYY